MICSICTSDEHTSRDHSTVYSEDNIERDMKTPNILLCVNIDSRHPQRLNGYDNT